MVRVLHLDNLVLRQHFEGYHALRLTVEGPHDLSIAAKANHLVKIEVIDGWLRELALEALLFQLWLCHLALALYDGAELLHQTGRRRLLKVHIDPRNDGLRLLVLINRRHHGWFAQVMGRLRLLEHRCGLLGTARRHRQVVQISTRLDVFAWKFYS